MIIFLLFLPGFLPGDLLSPGRPVRVLLRRLALRLPTTQHCHPPEPQPKLPG
jgi:hypothetical protein